MEAVGRSKLRDVVAKQLKNFILDSNLKPGDRLPTESELATALGISRLSLREATKSLEYLGIVEAKPGRGLAVGSVDLDHVAECVGFHPALQSVPPAELIGTRIVIETGALRYVSAAMNLRPEIYVRLNEINSKLRNASDIHSSIALDIEFHRELVLSSGLSPLTPFTDLLSILFQQFRENTQRVDWSLNVSSHQEIIDSLKAQNVSRASAVLKKHIEIHHVPTG